MKNIKLLIIIVILNFLNFLNSNAFLDDNGLNLYKKIDSGIYNLELKYLEKELKGGDIGGSIIDDLNKRAKVNNLEECFGSNISVEDIIDINYGNLEKLSNILEDCFYENSISTNEINSYLGIVKESYSQNYIKSQDKVDNIYKIGKIGLYSDGIKENSPFDLIVDLQNIDKIIFEEKIPYDGVNQEDLGKIIDQVLGGDNNNGSLDNPSFGDYTIINDNSMWPCNNFFCMTIDFITYNHNLLGGGKKLSIEGLIKRSNEHLKKFAATSLIQSEMSVNNFELSFRDLNLPDLFHIGVIVSYKSVPIFNLDKNEQNNKRDETDFASKNLFSRYYKSLGLDYKRANDLDIFLQKESELKSLLDSIELQTTEAEKKYSDYKEYIDNMKKEIDYVSNTIIDKKILEEDMYDFYKQFIEVEGFTKAMLDYTFSLNGIIKKMKEIPIGGN